MTLEEGRPLEEDLAYGNALHWYDSENDAWVRYDVQLKAWRGWKHTQSEELPVRPREWRPWSELVDTSAHPYIRSVFFACSIISTA